MGISTCIGEPVARRDCTTIYRVPAVAWSRLRVPLLIAHCIAHSSPIRSSPAIPKSWPLVGGVA